MELVPSSIRINLFTIVASMVEFLIAVLIRWCSHFFDLIVSMCLLLAVWLYNILSLL